MHLSVFHIILLVFLLATITHTQSRIELKARRFDDWLLDGVSLFFYFIILPVAQMALGYTLYSLLFPDFRNSIEIGWGTAFIIHIGIDYIWYWNHRLFHAQTPLWNLHSVHHEATHLDILASQRNSIVSFLFMSYFWLSPLVLFLAKNASPFLTLGGVAMVINFWGHTRFDLPRNSAVRRVLSLAIIQPEDHFWHHSTENPHCNFSTVFNFWDKLHGTWHQPNQAPKSLGFDSKLPLWRKILFPTSYET